MYNCSSAETVPIDQFTYNETLGREQEVITLVKWVNQGYHDDNLRSLFEGDWDPVRGISKANSQTHNNQYYDGLIVRNNLDTDMLQSSDASYVERIVQPTAIDHRDHLWVIGAANKLYVRHTLEDPSSQIEVNNDWFARLHAAEFIDDTHIVVASTAFDLLAEVALDGSITWEMDTWSAGYDINRSGHRLSRQRPTNAPFLLNPDCETLTAPNQAHDAVSVIDNPRKYKGLGLTSYATPAYPNGLHQVSKEKLLVTSFRYGEAWLIDRPEKSIVPVIGGMKFPHGFLPYDNGYMVSDTGREEIVLLKSDFSPKIKFSFDGFTDRKPGLERARWLQNTIDIGSGLLAAISASRQKISLIDISRQQYRDIAFSPEWGIQTLFPLSQASPTGSLQGGVEQ